VRVELDVGQLVLPPGAGPKLLRDESTASELRGANKAVPHVHRRHVDAFFVVEGAIDFAARTLLPAGGFALAEIGVVHWFEAEDARIVNFHAPGTSVPQLCVFEFDASPGYVGPGPHLHREHVDTFYVLEGKLAFELDGESVAAPTGTFVAATPGTVHTFRNAGDGRARFLNLHAPGLRFDEYLRRQAAGENGRRFHESFDVYEVEVS
jgi:quercetin dioxygenase-like cupin family protein